MDYILLRIVSFVSKVFGGIMMFAGAFVFLIGLAGGTIVDGGNASGSNPLGAISGLINFLVAIGLMINGGFIFAFGEIVDALIGIHNASKSSLRQISSLAESVLVFIHEQRNGNLAVEISRIQSDVERAAQATEELLSMAANIGRIQTDAERAAQASDEILAIAKRGSRR